MKFRIERTLNGFDIIEGENSALNRYDVLEEDLSEVIKELFEEIFDRSFIGKVTFEFV